MINAVLSFYVGVNEINQNNGHLILIIFDAM